MKKFVAIPLIVLIIAGGYILFNQLSDFSDKYMMYSSYMKYADSNIEASKAIQEQAKANQMQAEASIATANALVSQSRWFISGIEMAIVVIVLALLMSIYWISQSMKASMRYQNSLTVRERQQFIDHNGNLYELIDGAYYLVESNQYEREYTR